jgi:hypothetical protein
VLEGAGMKTRIINVLKIIWLPLVVICLGALLNTVVVRANGGMPAFKVDYAYGQWVPITTQTHYAFLGDIIPLFGYQCSIGDFVMPFGAAIYFYKVILYIYRGVKEVKARQFSWY